jgi:hypothetical protein
VTVRATVAAIRRPKPRGRPAKVRVPSDVRQRLDWLVSALGNNKVAELLGVNRSQPSRWRSGKEGLAAENQRALVDLDYVIARLHQVWTPEVAKVWLTSPNAFLGGGTPVETLKQRGVLDVIAAIDAEAAGAYV